jgi:eukaryotic-like serine/threonine-protein kinase
VVRDLIAAGGFGTVYRVEHHVLARPAALKILHPEGAGSPEVVSRFEREARAVNVIRHPNVVDIFDLGRTDDGRPYFVMELLEGIDLGNQLERHGRMSPEQALEIFEPLCAALAAAHAAGIVHRDIKPSNVFLAEVNGQRRVVLLDFGVAKLLSEAAPGLTASRETVGSPACMAPEQIRGEAVDGRTDVYALGILLFALVTGNLPFADESVIMMQQMHLFTAPPLPGTIAPVPPSIDRIVARAMQKEPNDRYQRVEELLADLRRAVSHSPEIEDRGAAGEVEVVAVHVGFELPPEHLDDPDPELLDELEGMTAAWRTHLEATGFIVALESGSGVLLVHPLADIGSAGAARILRDGFSAVASGFGAPAGVCIHVGTAVIADGRVRDGDVLRIGTWLPEAGSGVWATASAARRLPDLELEEVPGRSHRRVRGLDSGSG